MTQRPITQAQRDAIYFDCYVDCGRNAAEAARQQGVHRTTIRRAVSRYTSRDALAASAARHAR